MVNSEDKERVEFARRLNRALDESGFVNKGRGRQAEVAKMLGVTPGAARKWLEGESYPEMPKVVLLAKRLKVRVDWLIEGQGSMRVVPEHAETGGINTQLMEQVIEEAMEAIKEAGLESMGYSKQAKFVGYVYEEAAKEGRVDPDRVRKLLRILS